MHRQEPLWKTVAQQHDSQQVYSAEKNTSVGGSAPPARPTPTCCSSCARQYVKQDPRDAKWWQQFRRIHVDGKEEFDQASEDHFWRIFNQLPIHVYASLTWTNEAEYQVFLQLKGAK